MTFPSARRIYRGVHNTLMQGMVPIRGRGPLLKWVFKIPALFYQLGLGRFIGTHILILMTTGRRTGKIRLTPVEYSYVDDRDCYIVMAGWGWRTDWAENIKANNRLSVFARGKEFDAAAEIMTEEETTRYMMKVIQLNPGALEIFSRWADQPLEANPESLSLAAVKFPCFILSPSRPEYHLSP